MKTKKEIGCGKEFEREDGTYPICSQIQGLCPKCKDKSPSGQD